MVDLSAHKELHKNKLFVQLLFWGVTFVMLTARYASFYTYSGADDLHYAFLSNKMLHGTYDIFSANDIFSARALVIAYQALWFKLFGINDITISMPSLSILIVLAWLVCFKCNFKRDVYGIVLGSSLVYFNPVVSRSTLGNLPDVYIALIALLVMLLIKKSSNAHLKYKNIGWGIIAGLLLIAGLFVKETIIIIYAGTGVLLLYYRKRVSCYFITALATSFLVGIIGYLLFYYIHTGDLFYRFVQIKNSSYFNSCSYGCLPKMDLLKRLTVSIPFAVIVKSAYPLLLLMPALFVYRKQLHVDTPFWKTVLAVFTVLALYFPFSIFPYVPLCHDMRQFFFLFPFASILYLGYLQSVSLSQQNFKSISIISAVVFAMAAFAQLLFTPYNKAAIFCTGLLSFLFIINVFLNKKLQLFLLYIMMPVVLLLSIAYPVYNKPHQGYASLKALNHTLGRQTNFAANTYYFINNDTKTHFAVINKFSVAKQLFNLDTLQRGFKPFIKYQPQIALDKSGAFQEGWLIVSDSYLENMSIAKITAIKQLIAGKYFCIRVNKTSAYYLTSAETAEKIMHIINSNNVDSNCY